MATVNDGMHIEVTASSIGAKEAFEETRQSLELISAAILSLNNRFDDLRAQSSKPIKLSWGNEVANGMEQAGFYIERGFSKIVKGLTASAAAIGRFNGTKICFGRIVFNSRNLHAVPFRYRHTYHSSYSFH